jgi:hypothetical protein
MDGETSRSGKGLIRSLNRRGTRSDKSPRVASKTPKLSDPSLCELCGCVYSAKRWKRNLLLAHEALALGAWTVCPACLQVEAGRYYGQVEVTGLGVAAKLDSIRRRIANVERRARFTQPERRVVASEWDGSTLEVRTTSQKLAHRIARELEKAFGGHARYHWSEPLGKLHATCVIDRG